MVQVIQRERELLPLEVQELSLLQARERLAHPPMQVQPVPPPLPVEALLPRMPEPELPPMPSAEEQLGSLLGGPSTPRTSSPSSLS